MRLASSTSRSTATASRGSARSLKALRTCSTRTGLPARAWAVASQHGGAGVVPTGVYDEPAAGLGEGALELLGEELAAHARGVEGRAGEGGGDKAHARAEVRTSG